MKWKRNDFLLLLALLCIVLISSFYYKYKHSETGDTATITVDGTDFGSFSLTKNQQIPITDSNGVVTNTLLIENGYAYMIEASCPDKLCTKQKKIQKNGETIICLPNKVTVTINAKNQQANDAIAY